ncbi:MAG: phosphatase PAP2 family protein [Sphingomonadales bacterium]|nr:phosphatase PAP2 family protein [Sphingomonadales bacterium]MDE2568666.1 phosphatase PAP2 family protein [Sphingomonadales bacterium]
MPRSLFLGLLGVNGAVVLALLIHSRLVVGIANPAFLALAGAVSALFAIRHGLRRPADATERRLRDFAEYTLLFMAISLLGVIASYPAAAATRGFADPMLASGDRLMRFDWIALYRLVSAHPSLQYASVAAYACIFVSPALLIGHFAWADRRDLAQRFLLTFWLAAVLTLLLFPLFPAEGPLAFMWRGPIPYMPTSALYQQQLIPALRSHQLTAIDLGSLRGLVCAPSFHTVAGVLYVIAAWPVKRLRWIIAAITAAMLLATPVEGTHYLTDMIFGLLVAVTADMVVRVWLGYRKAAAVPLVAA